MSCDRIEDALDPVFSERYRKLMESNMELYYDKVGEEPCQQIRTLDETRRLRTSLVS